MKNFMFLKVLLVIPVVFCIISCSQNNNDECTGKEICTQIYASAGITVLDAGNNPVKLDSMYVILVDNGAKLPEEYKSFPNENGYYAIVGDMSLKKLKKNGSQIKVEAYIGNPKVFEEFYLIGHDCCHISKISGKDTIYIQ